MLLSIFNLLYLLYFKHLIDLLLSSLAICYNYDVTFNVLFYYFLLFVIRILYIR